MVCRGVVGEGRVCSGVFGRVCRECAGKVYVINNYAIVR